MALFEESREEIEMDEADSGRSPFDRVYRGLLRGIYEGRYVPGQRLVAPDLMLQFDVGRGTIREVLNRMAASGIVSIVPNRGAMVRALSRQEALEILDVVQALLGLAARRAAENGNLVGTGDLQERYEELREHEGSDDFAGFVDAREAYYRLVVELSGNRELQRLFPTVQVHMLRAQLRRYNRAADSMQFSDYAAITAAIFAGDGKAAQAAATHHVENTIANVRALPDRAFLTSR